jgi:D-alanyl-D-alanine dipeptidase
VDRRLLFTLILSIAFNNMSANTVILPKTTRQCIVVVTDLWASTTGNCQCFEREKNGPWKKHGKPIPVVLGRAGLAWGRGEIHHRNLNGTIKREGDNKAPAGIFRLGTAFGYAKTALPTRMPYFPLTPNVAAVDDPKSRYYNQLVDRTKIRDADWRSAENMILNDHRYKWGVWVKHNDPPISGAGSCIFLHVWKDRSTLTSGCTAMSERDMVRLLGWLDPAKNPLLIQLPRSIYSELQSQLKLPGL